jgi:hypothetical protein
MVAQRCTRKEVGLENALPEKWGLKGSHKSEGTKAHSKWGKVRKRTTQKVMVAQRRTWKKVRLENALLEK